VSSDSIPLPGIRLLDLHGRTALITGGSRGLGLAMAPVWSPPAPT